MKTYSFRVVLEPDEDAEGGPAWHAYCPALVDIGAATSGRSKDEALKRINELVHMIIAELVEEGHPIPDMPEGEVEVTDLSQDAPRIAITI